MIDINKEVRLYGKNKPDDKKGQNGLTAIKSNPILTIDDNGNITKKEINKYYLVEYGRKTPYTNDYYGIMHIINDCYIVLEVEKNKLKFGIIELQRNCFSKEIEKKNEKIIAPIEYDRIYVYDPLYPILEKDGHYTYFCLDPKSPNYKKQLVPLILDTASPFNIKYPNYAECTFCGETRFLAIDFIAAEAITPDDLLTEEEVIYLKNSYNTFKKLKRTTNRQIPQTIKNLQK
ncbi:MAG: hypothetical protein IJE89_05420 [Bacilli bacterium]|nr:hypothetical protein [Bacilli bacterium]